MRFSSLLCIAIMMVVNTSASWISSSSVADSIDDAMVGEHALRAVTAAVHSFHTLQSSGPTSSVFGEVGTVSAACKAANIALETNTNVSTTLNQVVKGGCTDPGKQQVCDKTTKICTCTQTFTNDQPFRTAVSQAGGSACSVSLSFVAASSAGNVNFVYTGISGLQPVATSTCGDADLTAFLNFGFDGIAAGIKSSSSGDTKITSITGTMTFCNASLTATRQTSQAHNNKQYGVALIIAAIITFITMQ